MNILPLRARTIYTKEWYQFYVSDIPVFIDSTEFILLYKHRSPKLSAAEIHHGCAEYSVFEGDVILADGEKYLVQYSGGFYAISLAKVVRTLYSFKSIEKIAEYDTTDFAGMFKGNNKHLFKINNTVFPMRDIVCGSGNSIYLLSYPEELPADRIQQFCRFFYRDKKLFLGDSVQGATIKMAGGRVVIEKEDGNLFDLYREEIMDGYYPGNIDG